ncbi:MAG: cation-translocating P-type ATPase [Pirellulaceae bacterium]
MSDWHHKDVAAVLRELDSDADRGLSDAEAAKRQAKVGPNELRETGGRSALVILWDQLRGAMVLLLVVAAGVSIYLDEYADAGVVAAIIVLNAALGFAQDYRAEKALAALKQMAKPTVKVRRDGVVKELSSRDLAPGDIVLLETGNYVSADCRLLESMNLRVQESTLTGESEPVEKQVEPLETEDAALGDRRNMAYMGTVVTYGHGVGVVTEIGMQTELGHIAHSLQSVKSEPTPLQRRLGQLGRTLALVAIGIIVVVFLVGVLRSQDIKLMLMTALSMAVAVVPEGLPAVATVALALGARRMFQRRALIRKLPAVETLGSVTTICSDKTGTLTENRMTVTVIDVVGDRLDLTEQLQRDDTGLRFGEVHQQQVADESAFSVLLAAAALCNDAELEYDSEQDQYHSLGDPTEAALVVAAARLGLPRDRLTRMLPRVAEAPFDSERKRMTTVHHAAPRNGREADSEDPEDAEVRRLLAPLLQLDDADYLALTKGAVDTVIDVCEFVWIDGEPQPLDEKMRTRIQQAHDGLAEQGMRILGFALRPIDEQELSRLQGDSPAGEQTPDGAEAIERELIFVGLAGMIDPPRPEAREAVERCRTAGIRPVMITGDHPLTAMHVGRQLGIAADGEAVTGRRLAEMSSEQLKEQVEKVSVFARVAPAHKLQIVKALQELGHVVAMTGDGVNDAPALKQAHIGVAMGITGTDVSKEAADIVLLDDNFATIVNAVEEGRKAYDNIRKFVMYTMTSNAGEVCAMLLAPLLGMPLPLLPIQILWINLVTDGLPGLALAVEPAERNTMRRAPYPPGEHVFGRGMGWDVVWIGLLMGAVSLAMGYWAFLDDAENVARWRTIVFTVLTLSQMGNALAVRSISDSLFRLGLLTNLPLLGSVVLTFVLQMVLIYYPPMQDLFKTTALSGTELALCLVLSTVVFWAVEARKLFVSLRSRSA